MVVNVLWRAARCTSPCNWKPQMCAWPRSAMPNSTLQELLVAGLIDHVAVHELLLAQNDKCSDGFDTLFLRWRYYLVRVLAPCERRGLHGKEHQKRDTKMAPSERESNTRVIPCHGCIPHVDCNPGTGTVQVTGLFVLRTQRSC